MSNSQQMKKGLSVRDLITTGIDAGFAHGNFTGCNGVEVCVINSCNRNIVSGAF